MELKELDQSLLPPYSPTLQPLSTSSKYSLSSAGSAHSSNRSPWQEEVDMDHHDLPSINPSDHTKTLLSQLASNISAMKGSFTRLQATLRAHNGAVDGSTSTISPAEKVMVDELQRLSYLHIQLYSVLQEHGAMKQDILNGSRPESVCMQEEYVCRSADYKPQDGMLKSYEAIISRFYDEIRKKDAVAEALKETLAKAMLKGEKLERRVKFLEAQLSLK